MILGNKICVSCAEVYWCLADSGDGTAQEISDETGLAKKTVQKHLNTLEKARVIESRYRPKLYRPIQNLDSKYFCRLQELELVARRSRKARTTLLLPAGAFRGQGGHLHFASFSTVFDVGITNFSSSLDTYLFDSKEAAEEVAWVLGAEWDGLNAVCWSQSDHIALSTAAGLVGADYCQEGEGSVVLAGLIAGTLAKSIPVVALDYPKPDDTSTFSDYTGSLDP